MSTAELVSIIVAVAVFGLTNLGTLVFMLGGFKEVIPELKRRITALEGDVATVRTEVAILKGELT